MSLRNRYVPNLCFSFRVLLANAGCVRETNLCLLTFTQPKKVIFSVDPAKESYFFTNPQK